MNTDRPDIPIVRSLLAPQMSLVLRVWNDGDSTIVDSSDVDFPILIPRVQTLQITIHVRIEGGTEITLRRLPRRTDATERALEESKGRIERAMEGR